MALWNPWRGCHRKSEGCKYCYIHKGDKKRGVDTNLVVKTKQFDLPIQKYQRGEHQGEYKIKANEVVYVCFSSDFLIEEADDWRRECWQMIKQRSDLHFVFLTKRIERFIECIPDDWNEGYENVTVGCSVENQQQADYRLAIFNRLPIQHKYIICQPLLEAIHLENYLANVELVVAGGESDYYARPLNYDWVLSIRNQCIQHHVSFQFRQCGTHFIKDGKVYHLNKNVLFSQAKKAQINWSE